MTPILTDEKNDVDDIESLLKKRITNIMNREIEFKIGNMFDQMAGLDNLDVKFLRKMTELFHLIIIFSDCL